MTRASPRHVFSLDQGLGVFGSPVRTGHLTVAASGSYPGVTDPTPVLCVVTDGDPE